MDSESPSIGQNAAAALAQRVKFRLRFSKSGDLRLVSHHDLMHCFERMLRRAELPICATQGFHPMPRMVFALSLALGVVGTREVLELEMKHPIPEDEVFARLNARAFPGIAFHEIKRIEFKTTARVRRGFYSLPIPGDRAEQVRSQITELLAREDYWIVRTRPQRRRLNLRPFLGELALVEGHLKMALWITPYGAARPDEIAQALGLQDLLDAGAFFERTFIELYDELPADDAIIMPPYLRDLSNQPVDVPPLEDQDDTPREKSPKPTSLIGSPLSFDS